MHPFPLPVLAVTTRLWRLSAPLRNRVWRNRGWGVKPRAICRLTYGIVQPDGALREVAGGSVARRVRRHQVNRPQGAMEDGAAVVPGFRLADCGKRLIVSNARSRVALPDRSQQKALVVAQEGQVVGITRFEIAGCVRHSPRFAPIGLQVNSEPVFHG